MTSQPRRPGPNPKPLTRAEAIAAELAAQEPVTIDSITDGQIHAATAKQVKFERDRDIRLGASVPVTLIRRDFEAYGAAKAIATGRECFIEGTITDEQILAIARKVATLRGFSDTGITYHDQRCTTCEGYGEVPLSYGEARLRARQRVTGLDRVLEDRRAAQAALLTGRVRCPDCKGDGFAPSIGDSP